MLRIIELLYPWLHALPACMQSPVWQHSCPAPIFGHPCRVRLMYVDSSKNMNVVAKAVLSSSELGNKVVAKQNESSCGGNITFQLFGVHLFAKSLFDTLINSSFMSKGLKILRHDGDLKILNASDQVPWRCTVHTAAQLDLIWRLRLEQMECMSKLTFFRSSRTRCKI